MAASDGLCFDDVEAGILLLLTKLAPHLFGRWAEIVGQDLVNSSDKPAASHLHATPRRACDDNRTTFAAEDRSPVIAVVRFHLRFDLLQQGRRLRPGMEGTLR
jgi:hypothetical protein